MTEAALENLPEWNLADLYPAPDSLEFAHDIEECARIAKDFAAKWKGALAKASGAKLAQSLREYESLSDLVGRVGSYASLYYVGNTTDAARQKFYGDVNEKLTSISSDLLFFELEFNRLSDAAVAKGCRAGALQTVDRQFADGKTLSA
jgi:oligoendopeptidase F